ncbi:hypothetical protein DL96DRAFT_1581248 [Flagelloscypha sp. PMI_526]|nr:hypothetical protein DL96DRAFT_1581248 [Flagelloscypha sp. PMI_526]
MSVLPSDVCHEILRSLDISSLDSCALVNHEFHFIAQEHRFRHVVLDAKTWKTKCSFLLSDKGLRLRQRIRTLTIHMEATPFLQYDEKEVAVDLRDLGVLMSCIGPQLTTFRIEGLTHNDDGGVVCTQWSGISDYFRSQIVANIIPFIRTLELFEVVQLPILRIISEAHHLQSLYLSSAHEVIGNDEDAEDGITIPETLQFDVTIGVFANEDFNVDYSLGRFLEMAGKQISTLELHSSLDKCLPKLDFLDPFEDLRANVRHLLFSLELFEMIIQAKVSMSFLPLWTFTSLEILTLSIPAPKETTSWDTWFDWISAYINSPSSIPVTLRTVQFSVMADNYWDHKMIPKFHVNLNWLANNAPFSIEFRVPSLGGENTGQLIRSIRTCLSRWDKAGKLVFRVDLSSREAITM